MPARPHQHPHHHHQTAAEAALDFLPAGHARRRRRRRVDRLLLAAALVSAAGMCIAADTVGRARAAMVAAVQEQVRQQLMPVEESAPEWVAAVHELAHGVRCQQPMGVTLDGCRPDADAAGVLLIEGSAPTAGLVYQYVDALRTGGHMLQVDLRRLHEHEIDDQAPAAVRFELALRPGLSVARADQLAEQIGRAPASRCRRGTCAAAARWRS